MGDLINRTEAISNLRKWLNFPDYNKGERNIIACAIAMLEELPSAERKGKWIERGFYLPECSECGGKAYGLHAFDAVKSDYCPHCGARMDGEDEE